MNPSRRAEKAQQNWWSIRVKIEGAFDRGLRARSEGNSLLKVDRSRLRELPSKRHPNTASKSRPKRHERTSAEMAVEATAQISTLVRVSALRDSGKERRTPGIIHHLAHVGKPLRAGPVVAVESWSG
jgi:hypothetical protein